MSVYRIQRIYSNPVTDTVDSVKKAGHWVSGKYKEYKDDPKNIKKDAKAVGKFIKENPGLAVRVPAELAAGYIAVPWAVNKGLSKGKFFKKHGKITKTIAAATALAPIGETMAGYDIARTLKKKKKGDK